MDVNTLKSIYATLNSIEVRGRANMSKLLGCLETLEAMIQQVTHTTSEQEVDNGG